MNTIDQLLNEIRSESEYMEKQASPYGAQEETLELLNSLKNRISDDAATNSIIKHASVAAQTFSKTAAQQFKASVITDEFAEKVASLLFRKLAGETSTMPISDAAANVVTAPAQNPQEASVQNATRPLPPEVEKMRKETGNMIASTGLVDKVVADQGSPTHEEVAKQADAMGVDMNVLDALAEQYMDLV